MVEQIISETPDLFVVEVSHKGNKGTQKLVIKMDGDNGIGIDQCASISRQLGARIEEQDLIQDKFILEVTSAGLDSPLRIPRQFAKNVGRSLKVVMNDGGELEGKLKDFKDGVLQLEVEDEIKEINSKDIEKSVVVVSFK